MVISDVHKYVFIAVAKTGSTAVHQLLVEECHGYDFGEHHRRHVPQGLMHYFSFAVVRNPYTRFISLYYHARRTPSHPCYSAANYYSAEGYSYWMKDNPKLADMNQHTFLSLEPKVAVLKYENLKEELRALPFVGDKVSKLRELNVGEYKDTLITPAMERNIFAWAEQDFYAYGYERREL